MVQQQQLPTRAAAYGQQQQYAHIAALPYTKRELGGYVGFHNLPNQIHRKSVKKGFYFTFMVVGESGLGKSTLINTLFNTTIHPPKNPDAPSDGPKTVEIQSVSADLEEEAVRLHLTVIDTPGFGDFINNEECWKPVLETVEARYDQYYEQENKVHRARIQDTRIHACLYFIAPTGHSLLPLDVEFMRRLCKRVNLIPIIAKSDTVGEEEVAAFKARLLADMHANGITYYSPPLYDSDDAETLAENKEVAESIPFAVVGSEKVLDVGGKKVRGRQYPWGTIEVENEEHCDFVKLRQMFIRTHLMELFDHTNHTLYEAYRTQKDLGGVGLDGGSDALDRFEQERNQHEAKLAKMETEMKAVFQQKVAEKEARLKQSEDELYARHREMKEQLERQRRELETKKRLLETGGGRPGTPETGKKWGKNLFNK